MEEEHIIINVKPEFLMIDEHLKNMSKTDEQKYEAFSIHIKESSDIGDECSNKEMDSKIGMDNSKNPVVFKQELLVNELSEKVIRQSIKEAFPFVNEMESLCRGGSSEEDEPFPDGEERSKIIVGKNSSKDDGCELVTRRYLEQISLHENSTELMSCNKCSFVTMVKEDLSSHFLDHFELRNPEAMDFSPYKKRMGNNELLIDEGKFKLYQCLECEFETNQKRTLKVHTLSKHSDEKEVFRCPDCDYISDHKRSFYSHSLKHRDKPLFECSQCEYKTNFKNCLTAHELNHSGKKLFECSDCDYRSNHRSAFKAHQLKHSETSLFRCSECDYQTNRLKALRLHVLKHSGQKFLKCPRCSYETNDKSYLKLHLMNHSDDKAFSCPQCSYKTNYKYRLKTHSFSHLEKKRFNCSECGFGTHHRSIFTRHCLTHSASKAFKCPDCSYETHCQSNLKRHSLVHNEKKKYQCRECVFETNKKKLFLTHELKHRSKLRETNVESYLGSHSPLHITKDGALDLSLRR